MRGADDMELKTAPGSKKTPKLFQKNITKLSDYGVGMLILIPPVLIVVIVFLVPFISSFISSFQRDGVFSLENYNVIRKLYVGDILYTIGISVGSLLLILLITVIVGGFLRIKNNHFVEFLFKVPLFVPFVVVGHAMRVFLAPKGILNLLLSQVGLVDISNPPGYAFGSSGIIIALTWKNMALALLLVMGAFRSVDESYLEAARNFGASTVKQIKDILLPMSLSSIGVSSILIFTSIMASFSIPVMIGSGEGPQMLMIDVYYRIVYQNDLGVANALGVVSYLAASFAAYYYLKKVLKND